MGIDINGNWDDVKSTLEKMTIGTRGSTDFLEEIVAANARAAQQAFFGMPGGDADSAAIRARTSTRGGTVARAFWWGFHIEISHDDLQHFLAAANPINELIGAIGGSIPSPAQPFIALAAAFVAGALSLLKSLDRGRGVYVSMSWFAPGVFIPTSV